MKSLRSLLSKSRPGIETAAGFDEPFEPSKPFFAIGDLHGCQAKLQAALAAIHDIDPDAPIICVGDLIDRGEQSAHVLRHLVELSGRTDKVVCLMGNHEQMCLKFLDDPRNQGDRWLRYGGLQTLASFGISWTRGASMTETRNALADAMGDAMIAWMRALPVFWISGNVAVTHAGADPRAPIGAQPTRNLVWGHADFETTPRQDGMWVMHGHTIVEAPGLRGGRISIDTGAYATGRLTVAQIARSGVKFITV